MWWILLVCIVLAGLLVAWTPSEPQVEPPKTEQPKAQQLSVQERLERGLPVPLWIDGKPTLVGPNDPRYEALKELLLTRRT